MKKLSYYFFTFLAWLLTHALYAQDDILNKLKNSQKTAKSTAEEYLEIFFGFADIALAIIIGGWAILAWRNSKRTDNEDGEAFNLMSFLKSKGMGLIAYIVIRIVALQLVR